MSEREIVLDEPVLDEQSIALQNAVERAERAEAELAKVKSGSTAKPTSTPPAEPSDEGHAAHDPQLTGIEALRQDAMMTHLLDSLAAGKDIGHYGRLVFAMIARHFLSDAEVTAELTRDRDFSEEQASTMLRQVEDRDYSPPRRERIMEWQSQQDFPIIPHPEDPDCGNTYRSFKYPSKTYKHIEHYQEEKSESA